MAVVMGRGGVPTSVLLAVLAAAGLLALAPALVRRYDATERLAAERAQSAARVLDRQRRRRTVPGAVPINGPRARLVLDELADEELEAPLESRPVQATPPVGQTVWVRLGRTRVGAGNRPGRSRQQSRVGSVTRRSEPRSEDGRQGRRRPSKAVYRRRRALLGLVLINVIELV